MKEKEKQEKADDFLSQTISIKSHTCPSLYFFHHELFAQSWDETVQVLKLIQAPAFCRASSVTGYDGRT